MGVRAVTRRVCNWIRTEEMGMKKTILSLMAALMLTLGVSAIAPDSAFA